MISSSIFFRADLLALGQSPDFRGASEDLPLPECKAQWQQNTGVGGCAGLTCNWYIYMTWHIWQINTLIKDVTTLGASNCDCLGASRAGLNLFVYMLGKLKHALTKINYFMGEYIYIWVGSRWWACVVTWFCSQMIAKPGKKTGPP